MDGINEYRVVYVILGIEELAALIMELCMCSHCVSMCEIGCPSCSRV